LSSEQWFRKIWRKGEPLEGYVFEALVAREMVYNMKCESCGCSGCLRWTGGIDAAGSWADVICTKCMASYEIKSKKSEHIIDRNLRYNSFRGGSFRKFCQNKGGYKTRYLVVVSREEAFNRELGASAHRVSIGKIKKVLPRLCSESFIDTGAPHMRMVSKVEIARETWNTNWCHVKPFRDESYEAIGREVFENFHGEGAWSLDEKVFENF